MVKAWLSHNYALWAVGAAAGLMPAFYMTRQVWLVFYGPERWREPAPAETEAEPREVHEPHESPWTMYVPLAVLAVLSVVGGFIDLPFTNHKINILDHWLGLPESRGATSF